MIGFNVRSNDFYSSKRNLIVSKDIFKNRRHSQSKLSNTVAKKISEKKWKLRGRLSGRFVEILAFSRVLTQSRVNDLSHERRSTKRRRATEKVSFQAAVWLPFFRCPDLNGPERERATSRQCLRQSRLRPIFQRRRKRITCCSLLYRVHKTGDTIDVREFRDAVRGNLTLRCSKVDPRRDASWEPFDFKRIDGRI